MENRNLKLIYLMGIIFSIIFISLSIVDLTLYNDLTNEIESGMLKGSVNFIPDWFSIVLLIFASIMLFVSIWLIIRIYWLEFKFKKENEKLHQIDDEIIGDDENKDIEN